MNDSDSDKAEKFAELVTKNYEVVAHYTDREVVSENGFSVTLFVSKASTKNTGKYVL